MASLILLTVPIGDSGDITLNVLESLRNGRYFAVEDTRSFSNLLKTYEIDKANKVIFSFHDHSNESSLKGAIQVLSNGDDLYVASEAGSPIVSDPAFPLVKEAKKHNYQVKSFSGISSIIKALEISTVNPCPFSFHGFFPRENKKRISLLRHLASLGGAHIFF